MFNVLLSILYNAITICLKSELRSLLHRNGNFPRKEYFFFVLKNYLGYFIIFIKACQAFFIDMILHILLSVSKNINYKFQYYLLYNIVTIINIFTKNSFIDIIF